MRIELRIAEEAARVAASELVIGTHTLVDRALPDFAGVVGEMPNSLKLNLLLEPVFIGFAHLRARARKLIIGPELGVFLAQLNEKTLFYLSVCHNVIPSPDVHGAGNLRFVKPDGYEDLQREYARWSIVRQEQYDGAHSAIWLRFRSLLFGAADTERLLLEGLIERAFETEELRPPSAQIASFVAAVLANTHAIGVRFR